MDPNLPDDLKPVTQSLFTLSESLRQLGVMASDYAHDDPTIMQAHVNALIDGLRELSALSRGMKDSVQVPEEAIFLIDQGRDPAELVTETEGSARAWNDEVKGKRVALGRFVEGVTESLKRKDPPA